MEENKQLQRMGYIEENKQLICDLLCKALQCTDAHNDLLELKYDKERETVTSIYYNSHNKVINVSKDSGFAMIYDIISNL